MVLGFFMHGERREKRTAGQRKCSSHRPAMVWGEDIPRIAVKQASNGKSMGISIGSSPKTKGQKIIWWLCFAAFFGFITYVILKNIFGWE